jgi:histidine ammonia-lyase
VIPFLERDRVLSGDIERAVELVERGELVVEIGGLP